MDNQSKVDGIRTFGISLVGRSTGERTLISNVFMRSGVGNSLPVLLSKRSHTYYFILNMVLDYFANSLLVVRMSPLGL